MDKTRELLKILRHCEEACNICAQKSLKEENRVVVSMEACVTKAWDCADFCNLATQILKRDSEKKLFAILISKKICRDCAAECQKHNKQHCRTCAEACLKCAEECHHFLYSFLNRKNRTKSPASTFHLPEREIRSISVSRN